MQIRIKKLHMPESKTIKSFLIGNRLFVNLDFPKDAETKIVSLSDAIDQLNCTQAEKLALKQEIEELRKS